jgi:rhodanese-related sulfurtransferase
MVPTRISAAEVKQRLDLGEPVLFIDTRSAAAWDESAIKIPGAYRAHYSELKKHITKLPRDRTIVPYCT